MPLTSERRGTLRSGGRNGSLSVNSSSVKALSYRQPPRSSRLWFCLVHMPCPRESTRTGAQNHNRFSRLKKIRDGLLVAEDWEEGAERLGIELPSSLRLVANQDGGKGSPPPSLHPFVRSCGAILSPRPHALFAAMLSGGQGRAGSRAREGLSLTAASRAARWRRTGREGRDHA